MASQTHSEACCSTPPVSADYIAKGVYQEIDGLKTYVTGPSTAKTALIMIYDVFGFSPQIVQGADILSVPKSKHPCRVFMPDFLAGNLADPAWFEANTPEKKSALASYFGPNGPAKADKMIAQLMAVRNALERQFEEFVVMGYCWGAKIAVLCAMEDSKFRAAIQVHPSGLDSKDAPKVTIPMCMLPSADEDKNVVKAFDEGLRVPKHVETFENAPHGWMTSRTDLSDEKMLADYRRGYTTVLHFLATHI